MSRVEAALDEKSAYARLADERAALQRVARLVAQAAPPSDVFVAVAAEVGALLRADVVHIARYEHDGVAVALAGWAREGETLPAGTSAPYSGRNVSGDVLRTGRPVRIDDYGSAHGTVAERVRSLGLRAAVGAPIVFEARVWGVVIASSKAGPFPPGTEERIAGFTELVTTTLTNAAAQEQWRRLTHEPAALERVATLVARDVPAGELLPAVAAEVGTLLGADAVAILRHEGDGSVSVRAVWPADRGEAAWGAPSAESAIVVDGHVWGSLAVQSSAPLPPEATVRLSGFAELVAAAAANARARKEARRLADEQAALRRVAMLVARERSADEVFDTIAFELRSLLNVEDVRLGRYDGDEVEIVAMSGPYVHVAPTGTRLPLTAGLAALVRRTGAPQRIDGPEVDAHTVPAARGRGYQTIVAVPLTVQGRLWGVLIAGARKAPFERGVEARLAEYAELMGLAVANLHAREELAASRARLVAAADAERRRVVRDLHDGAQQRLVHAVVTLKLAQDALRGDDRAALGELVGEALTQADQATHEMRELAHGIMPAVLTSGGLGAAVGALTRRVALPVDVAIEVGRLPPPVEATAYFVIAEALTNVAKHAGARRAAVAVRTDGGVVHVEVRDDGVGGATAAGSGLVGLADRVAAFTGTLVVDSPPEGGTRIAAAIPLPG